MQPSQHDDGGGRRVRTFTKSFPSQRQKRVIEDEGRENETRGRALTKSFPSRGQRSTSVPPACTESKRSADNPPSTSPAPRLEQQDDADILDGDDVALETDEDDHSSSVRVAWKDGVNLIALARRGIFHADISNRSESCTSASSTYPEGSTITHEGKDIALIQKQLRDASSCTQYQLKLCGDGRRCIAKALDLEKDPSARQEQENRLVSEVSIGFRLGRAAQIASFHSVIIPLPEIETTVNAPMIIFDLADCDLDLEHAIRTGTLWSEESASMWPLSTITLQLFLGLTHVHSQGIIHQVAMFIISAIIRLLFTRPILLWCCRTSSRRIFCSAKTVS